MVFISLLGRFVTRTRPAGASWEQLTRTKRPLSSISDSAHQKASAGFKLTEVRGNPWVVLSSPADVSLAHCVSSDFQMSSGIAREFKKKFENVTELKEQGKTVGEVAVLNRAQGSFVYYLITRERWWDGATPESVHSALTDMRKHCEENGVYQVAVPRLGTGDDRIDWPTVRGILENVFKDSDDITFTVFSSR